MHMGASARDSPFVCMKESGFYMESQDLLIPLHDLHRESNFIIVVSD